VIGFVEVPEKGPQSIQYKATDGLELPAWDSDWHAQAEAARWQRSYKHLYSVMPERTGFPDPATIPDSPDIPCPPTATPTTIPTTTPPAPTSDSNITNDAPQLAIDWTGTVANLVQQETFSAMLHRNHCAFTKGKKPGLNDWLSLELDTGVAVPVRLPHRRLARAESEAVHEQVKEWEDNSIIQPSRSPWAFPVVVVRKKNSRGEWTGWRCTVDYRSLNSHPQGQRYELPIDTGGLMSGQYVWASFLLIT